MPPSASRRLALIACQVLESEIQAYLAAAPHVVRTEYFPIGLHDWPNRLRTELVAALARCEADPSVEAVALAYGVCGRGTLGLTPHRCELAIPRAHDCITLFLGSKERYAEIMAAEPGTFWYTPGWNRSRRVPGPEREDMLRREYSEQFGEEEAEALLEMERETYRHGCAAYSDFRLPGNESERHYAQACAAWLGWKFREQRGDPRLLKDLLQGNWDPTRFLVLRPGQKIGFSADEWIVRAEPCPLQSAALS